MPRRMTITIRTDTPLLQGGAVHLLEQGAGKGWKLETRLRESQIKGLLHTFARALFLPLFGGNVQMAKHAERLLLGAPAGTTWKKNDTNQEYGKVLSIETSGPDSVQIGTYPNRPGDNRKGQRQGLQPGGTCTITIRLLPWVPEPEAHLKALWGVLWTGLCFGGIGIRSRRGYGGLTPTEIVIQPVATEESCWKALVFPDPPASKEALVEKLSAGFTTAQSWVQAWVACQKSNKLTLAPRSSLGEDPFQIAGLDQVFIGEARNGGNAPWEAVMISFMHASSKELDRCKKEHSNDHREIIGSASNPRLASPVWLRIFKTKSGYVPVITLGSSKTFNGPATPKPIVQALLDSVGAKPISEIIPAAGTEGAIP